eukprot:2127643-Amphidinium_carterae.1
METRGTRHPPPPPSPVRADSAPWTHLHIDLVEDTSCEVQEAVLGLFEAWLAKVERKAKLLWQLAFEPHVALPPATPSAHPPPPPQPERLTCNSNTIDLKSNVLTKAIPTPPGYLVALSTLAGDSAECKRLQKVESV